MGAASLDLLAESDWRANIARLESALQKGLAPCLGSPAVADVRVLGGIGVVEMREAVDVAALQEQFVADGVWIRPFGRLIYLMPPYVAREEEVEMLTGAIRRVVGPGGPPGPEAELM